MILLLDSRAAAQRIGVSPNSLAKWRVYGIGPVYRKFGRKVLYEDTAIDAFIARHPVRRSTSDTVSTTLPPNAGERGAKVSLLGWVPT